MQYENYQSQDPAENITMADAQTIADYCAANAFDVPIMRLVSNGSRVFEDGLTFNDAVKLNNFPVDEPYLITGKFPQTGEQNMGTIALALYNNDKGAPKYPGWEDYVTMYGFTHRQYATRQDIMADWIRSNPKAEEAIFNSFKPIEFPEDGAGTPEAGPVPTPTPTEPAQ